MTIGLIGRPIIRKRWFINSATDNSDLAVAVLLNEKLLETTKPVARIPKSFSAHHDLSRLLVKLKKYEEAVSILQRDVELNKQDPGVHYQLFLAFSRLKRKSEADQELAAFKQLDEANKHAPTPMGSLVREALPPLPETAAGEINKVRPPQE